MKLLPMLLGGPCHGRPAGRFEDAMTQGIAVAAMPRDTEVRDGSYGPPPSDGREYAEYRVEQFQLGGRLLLAWVSVDLRPGDVSERDRLFLDALWQLVEPSLLPG